jgi:hypothetical protein
MTDPQEITKPRDPGTGIDKNEAIKSAIEAAKRIKAKLDDKNVKEDLIAEDGIKDNGKGHLHQKSFNISNSKYITLLTNTVFPSLLRSKLQLGPHEHFSTQISSRDGWDRIVLSASSQDILELAEKELLSVQETGQFRLIKQASQSQPVIIEKVHLGFDPISSHVSFLRGKLLGPQGSFLKHIQSSTRTRVQLRGKGSGYFDVTEPKDGTPGDQEVMHLRVEGTDSDGVKEAKQLCEDLIATARSEYEIKIAPRPSQNIYQGYPNYQVPAYYPPPTPEQYYAMQQAYAQYYAQLAAQTKNKDSDNE